MASLLRFDLEAADNMTTGSTRRENRMQDFEKLGAFYLGRQLAS
jgi:hypothetical protein